MQSYMYRFTELILTYCFLPTVPYFQYHVGYLQMCTFPNTDCKYWYVTSSTMLTQISKFVTNLGKQ